MISTLIVLVLFIIWCWWSAKTFGTPMIVINASIGWAIGYFVIPQFF